MTINPNLGTGLGQTSNKLIGSAPTRQIGDPGDLKTDPKRAALSSIMKGFKNGTIDYKTAWQKLEEIGAKILEGLVNFSITFEFDGTTYTIICPDRHNDGHRGF